MTPKHLFPLLPLIGISAIALIPMPARSQLAFPAQVLSIQGGDSIKVQQGSDRLTVRLACVETPAIRQPSGKQALTRLRELLPVGAEVQLKIVGIDRLQRTVAEVFRYRESVNLQLVREGLAVVYPQQLQDEGATVAYRQQSHACRRDREIYDPMLKYHQAQTQAQRSKLGFWSQDRQVMPWDDRKGGR